MRRLCSDRLDEDEENRSGYDGGQVVRTVLRRVVLQSTFRRNGRVDLVGRPRGEVAQATVS